MVCSLVRLQRDGVFVGVQGLNLMSQLLIGLSQEVPGVGVAGIQRTSRGQRAVLLHLEQEVVGGLAQTVVDGLFKGPGDRQWLAQFEGHRRMLE